LETLKKEDPNGYQDSALWAWLEWFFFSQFKTTPFPVILFQLNTPKGTAKAPALDLLRLNNLGDTKTAF